MEMFELRKVHASVADFLGRFGTHYRNEAFANISKVLFNYLSVLKLFTSEKSQRTPVRLPRHFPADPLVTTYNNALAYGQNLLSAYANGMFVDEIYLTHVWVGGCMRWNLVIFTHKNVILFSAIGLVWKEPMDDFHTVDYHAPKLHFTFKNHVAKLTTKDSN